LEAAEGSTAAPPVEAGRGSPSRGRLSAAWASYAVVGTVGYIIYGIGAIGPYLRTQLHLSDAEVGLHSTGIAIGIIVAGFVVGRLGRRYGEIPTRGLAIGLLALAVIALGLAPSVQATLAAVVVIGFGLGTILGYANATLAAPGGVLARSHLARANVWAMVAAASGPVILATAATVGPGWWLGLVPAIGLLAVLALDLASGPRLRDPLPEDAPTGDGRLPRRYWLAWVFLVAAIAAEFSIVFWAATLVERRTGVSTAEATLVGALFLAGMFAGRLVLSAGVGAGRDVRQLVAGGLVLAAIGSILVWVSTSAPLSGVALFVAGAGISGLYPLGVSAALAAAPGRLAVAGTRLNLASGLAVLVAPFALGAVADRAGVVVGWGLVIGLVVVAAALARGLAVPPRVDTGSAR
jgi:MFS family permease